MTVGGRGLKSVGVIGYLKEFPSKCFGIKTKMEKCGAVGNGIKVIEHSAVTDSMMKADFGNNVSPASPIEDPRIACAFEMI
jgi:hypothetical protein